MFLELGLLLYGVYSVISSRFSIGKDVVVTGKKARILGVLCLSPLPVSMMVALFWVLTLFTLGIYCETGKSIYTCIFIESGVVLVVLWFLFFLGYRFCAVPSRPHPRTLMLLTAVVLGVTLVEVRGFGYRLVPPMFWEQFGTALWGLALGALGGGAFGLCTRSELRREAKHPDEE